MTDNNRLKRSIEIDVMDALILARAALVGANTAMMGQYKGAEERMRRYQGMFMELVPESVKVFNGETWCELGMALVNAKAVHVTLEPPRWRDNLWHGGNIVVVLTRLVDGDETQEMRFRSKDADHKQGTTVIEEIHDILVELAPLDCIASFDSQEERRYAW